MNDLSSSMNTCGTQRRSARSAVNKHEAKLRRKLQNKLNQRARRERLASQNEGNDRGPYHVHRWRLFQDSPRSTSPVSDQERNSSNDKMSTQAVIHTASSEWASIGSIYDCRLPSPRLPSPRADFLLSLVQFNTYRGLYDNKVTLSQSVRSIMPGMGKIPFETAFPCIFQIIPETEAPSSLALTKLQTDVLHAPWIDLVPFRQMRNVLIENQFNYDPLEIMKDLVGDVPNLGYLSSIELSPALQDLSTDSNLDPKTLNQDEYDDDEITASRTGFILWGDPYDENNWEITPGFLRKWSWVMKGSEYLLHSTNKWRAIRGEDPIAQGTYSPA